MQSRAFPDNALMSFIFGSARSGVESSTAPSPGRALSAHRCTRPAVPGGARPLVLNFHGGGFVFGSFRMSD